MLNKLVIGYLAFILKGELRHHCGTCSIKVKLTTFFRELWKWVLVVSTAGNVKGCSGFSFLWLKKNSKLLLLMSFCTISYGLGKIFSLSGLGYNTQVSKWSSTEINIKMPTVFKEKLCLPHNFKMLQKAYQLL